MWQADAWCLEYPGSNLPLFTECGRVVCVGGSLCVGGLCVWGQAHALFLPWTSSQSFENHKCKHWPQPEKGRDEKPARGRGQKQQLTRSGQKPGGECLRGKISQKTPTLLGPWATQPIMKPGTRVRTRQRLNIKDPTKSKEGLCTFVSSFRMEHFGAKHKTV